MIRRLFPEMRSMMRHIDDTLPVLFARRVGRWGDGWCDPTIPPADLTETKDKYLIEAEVPGVSKDDIRFELPDEHTLVMRAEVKGKTDRPGGERFYGMLERMFTVSSKINPESLKAELRDGILTVEVEKSPESTKPLQISWKESKGLKE